MPSIKIKTNVNGLYNTSELIIIINRDNYEDIIHKCIFI